MNRTVKGMTLGTFAVLLANTASAGVTSTQANDPFYPGPNPLLMKHPTVNATSIVFEYAGDLWSVARSGGAAQRLTTDAGIESEPFFSPDGTQVLFSGEYDGNQDVYVIPATGGSPKRLTFHPATDRAAGWTPDGKSALVVSSMLQNTALPRLFTVPVSGGTPKPLPLPSGSMGSLSADGQRIAYVAGIKWQDAWKRYRGGQTYAIWIADLKDSKWKEIPRKNTNDEQPMWIGDRIYFLSDKKGPVSLYSYDEKSGQVVEEVPPAGFDIKSATAGAGAIVYEKLGSIHLFDPKTKSSKRVEITISADFPEVRTQFKDLSGRVGGASISPSGQRVVIESRGHILTVPASKGDVRELTGRQGVAERFPAWSPDGQTIAFISDSTGWYELVLHNAGTKEEKRVRLGEGLSFFYQLVWSPDSKAIAYTDNKKNVWIHELSTGRNIKVDTGTFEDPNTNIVPRWSPDSRWLTWARDLDNHLNAVFVYSLDTAKTTQITDGLSNAKYPVFDRDGKHLYFVASTNTGPAASYLDISSYTNLNVVSSVYAIVLSKNGENPLGPESDEEAVKEPTPPTPPATPPGTPPATPPTAPPAGTPAGGPQGGPQGGPPGGPRGPRPAPKVTIDFEDISQRILALPMPTADYSALEAATPGSFLAVFSTPRATLTSPAQITLLRFSFATRRPQPVGTGIQLLDVNATGDKALIAQGGQLQILSTVAPAPPTPLDISNIRVKIDPRQEWRQMFKEVWRNERIFFYDPNLHGINAAEMERRYEPFLKNIASRADLNYLFTDMLGELSIGHMFIDGGDIPGKPFIPGGLLGADYAFENGRYRLTRVYNGENWNPGARAPLTAPGVNAVSGEYILAIDGQDLTEQGDIYEKLEAKAGKQVKIKIGPKPDGAGSREVTVVPVASEAGLRALAWREDNRRLVDKLSGGKIGYVHVPDTNVGGWTSFNRYYYAQAGKQGIVVDERYNQGGLINDYMVLEMTRTLQGVFAPRSGKDGATPGVSIFGPKVMLINQWAGSGGDMFPWLFRNQKVGKLVGKRTWGGLVRAFGFELVDGGVVRAPDVAFYNPNGTWDVEGWGVEPDIEVEMDPYLWRQGRDAQLERAVAEVLKEAATFKYPKPIKPPFPDRTKLDIRY